MNIYEKTQIVLRLRCCGIDLMKLDIGIAKLKQNQR